jgi:competence ComEA-like helix-hairpin-helix protein
MFKSIAEWFSLTKTERNVLLFLAVALLAGAGIRLYQVSYTPAIQFDYSHSDSTFAALSQESDENPDTLSGDEAGRLNINVATKEELMDLPGIGEVTADRILKHRDEAGRFTSVEGLRAIKGISKKKLEQIKPFIKTQ